MFRYDNSGKQSAPKEKQVKHVCQVRKVTYYNNHPDPKKKEPIISEGWEIVREIVVDPSIPLTLTPDVVGVKTVEAPPLPKKRKKKDFLQEKANGSD